MHIAGCWTKARFWSTAYYYSLNIIRLIMKASYTVRSSTTFPSRQAYTAYSEPPLQWASMQHGFAVSCFDNHEFYTLSNNNIIIIIIPMYFQRTREWSK